MDWMAGQLEGWHEEGARHNNPRPAGVIRPGSGTDVLLRFLRQAPGRWFFHSELVLALGRSKGEIDWALLYLVREGKVESRRTELPARKPVLRYRLISGRRDNLQTPTATPTRSVQRTSCESNEYSV